MAHQAAALPVRVFSYIVARDYGFAPNPFGGWCSLATCKPNIRRSAVLGDWIIGTGAKKNYDLAGHLLFAMRVDEVLSFSSYWHDPRFQSKRPVLNGSLRQIYGDNIYRREKNRWLQADSHHSLEKGRPNLQNIARDTGTDRVLLSTTFVYYGQNAPWIHARLRTPSSNVCCVRQGHKVLPDNLSNRLLRWIYQADEWGVRGMPLEHAVVRVSRPRRKQTVESAKP